MPLPWSKKTKGNRISRIVADLHPPQGTGALVVETGFPASVIDLFVKNRERMKRQSSKNNKPKQLQPEIRNSVAPPPTPLLSPDYSPDFAAEPCRKVMNANCSVGGEILAHSESGSTRSGAEEVVGGGANAKGVIVVAMKIFLVSVLALSTKKLAVGITLSAFLLLFLEFFGKFAVGFFRPCSDAQACLSSWIRKISGWFSFSPKRKNRRELRRICGRRREFPNRDDAITLSELLNGEEESNSCGEIQILEPNVVSETQHRDEGAQRDFLSRENRWGCVDVERLGEENEEEGKIQVSKNQRSRSAKLKAKIIKKLIPKKLRSGKKLKVSKTEICSELAPGNHSGTRPVEEEEEEDGKENEEGSISSGEQEEEDDRNRVSVSGGHGSAEIGMVEKGEEEMNNNFEFVFVVVMILWGLLGGRLLALGITVSGCFIFKMLKILNRKFKFV